MSPAQRAALTIAEVQALAKIIQAAHLRMRVARMVPGSDEPVRGQARGLVVSPDNPAFLRADADVRDAYLWVTTIFEQFWPVSELVREIARGDLAFLDIKSAAQRLV